MTDPTASAAATSNLTTLAPAVAPLSTGPDTSVVELGSGGSGGPGTQDIAFGGGGPSLTDCMSLWDKTTDMSKSEWKNTCERTMNGTELSPEDLSHVADVGNLVGDDVKSSEVRPAHHVARANRTAHAVQAAANARRHAKPQHEAQLD